MREKVPAKLKNNTFNLYVLLGIAFLSLLILNIFAYMTLSHLGGKYAQLSVESKIFAIELMTVDRIFSEMPQEFTPEMEKPIWDHFEKVRESARKLANIEPELELKENIGFYETAIKDALRYKGKSVYASLKKACDKFYITTIEKTKIFEERLNDKIAIQMHFVRVIYIALLANIFIIFGGIAYLINRYTRKQKKYEIELLKMNGNVESILNSLDSILISVGHDGTITHWNSNASKYFSRNEASSKGLKLYDIVPQFRKYEGLIEMVYRTGRTQNKYHEHVNFDVYRERILNILMAQITSTTAGEAPTNGVLIRIDDVTDRELVEQQKRRSQKMEVVENLVGSLVNDFNNVLGAITGTISMIKFSLSDNKHLPEDMQSNIELMESSAEKAVVMVQQLTALVNKEKGESVPVDINEAIMHVLKICQNEFDPSISIEAQLLEEKAMVFADPVRISLLLMCVCDNAADAMTTMRTADETPGGTLTVSVDSIFPEKKLRAKYPMMQDCHYLKIAVSDTGVGIDKETLTKIFDPFFSQKPISRGSGLGLTSAHETALEYKGFIDVSSTLGKGSTFTIYLPQYIPDMDKNEPLEHTISPEQKMPTGSGLILVVDDEIIMRKTAKKILEKLGYQVITANDGEEAVKIYSERSAEIYAVLLDMSMPKMSGTTAYLEMKKINPDIKALIMSGLKQNERMESAMELGINGFVQKPYRMDTLATAVKSLSANESGA